MNEVVFWMLLVLTNGSTGVTGAPFGELKDCQEERLEISKGENVLAISDCVQVVLKKPVR